jgi:transposase
MPFIQTFTGISGCSDNLSKLVHCPLLKHNQGEKLYIDFAGDTVPYVDRETGEVKQAQVFVATFSFSNYTFLMVVSSQKTEDFLHALSCALSYFGGSLKSTTF